MIKPVVGFLWLSFQRTIEDLQKVLQLYVYAIVCLPIKKMKTSARCSGSDHVGTAFERSRNWRYSQRRRSDLDWHCR